MFERKLCEPYNDGNMSTWSLLYPIAFNIYKFSIDVFILLMYRPTFYYSSITFQVFLVC